MRNGSAMKLDTLAMIAALAPDVPNWFKVDRKSIVSEMSEKSDAPVPWQDHLEKARFFQWRSYFASRIYNELKHITEGDK